MSGVRRRASRAPENHSVFRSASFADDRLTVPPPTATGLYADNEATGGSPAPQSVQVDRHPVFPAGGPSGRRNLRRDVRHKGRARRAYRD